MSRLLDSQRVKCYHQTTKGQGKINSQRKVQFAYSHPPHP